MKQINGFTFYRSYYESLKNLKEKDKKEIINAMLEYIFEDKNPNFSGIKCTIWTLIEPNLNVSKRHSNDNSGAPFGNQNARKNKEETNILDTEEINDKKQSKNNQKTTSHLFDKDKDKERDKDKEWDNMTINPTLASIIYFGEEMGIDKDYCEKFFNHYESIGWVNGTGQKIKNWKSVFKNWIKKDKKNVETEEEYIDEAGFRHVNGRRVF